MNVDLPDPDGPMMATNSPFSMVVDTWSSARRSISPSRYILLISRASISAILEPRYSNYNWIGKAIHIITEIIEMSFFRYAFSAAVTGSEHPRTCRGLRPGLFQGFDDDLLPFLEVAGRDFGVVSVADAGRYADALRFPFLEHPDPGAFFLRCGGTLPRALFRKPETQRRVRDSEHILLCRDDERDVGGHPRHELEIAVMHLNHHVIGDNVLNGYRSPPDLPDLALECDIGVGVDRKFNILSDFHHSDVRFGHIGIDLHFGQIPGYREQRRRLEARGHGLAHIHVPGDHHTVNGRDDPRVFKVRFGKIKSG